MFLPGGKKDAQSNELKESVDIAQGSGRRSGLGRNRGVKLRAHAKSSDSARGRALNLRTTASQK